MAWKLEKVPSQGGVQERFIILLNLFVYLFLRTYPIETMKWCFWERRNSLKVESDRDVDDAVGIGDTADEAEHQL